MIGLKEIILSVCVTGFYHGKFHHSTDSNVVTKISNMWYGNFTDLCNCFACWDIGMKPVEDKYNNSAVSVYVFQNASQVTEILIDISMLVADILPSIGLFAEFLISPINKIPGPFAKTSASDIMMAS